MGRALEWVGPAKPVIDEFQSSPVRMGRALRQFSDISLTFRVSILARPHGTGAPVAVFRNADGVMFQSSPVRMGRALCPLKKRSVSNKLKHNFCEEQNIAPVLTTGNRTKCHFL